MAPGSTPPRDDGNAIDDFVARALAAFPDLPRVRSCVDALALLTDDRAVFAVSVLTLELALAREAKALGDLAHHVGSFLEAYRDPILARILVGESAQLSDRWSRIKPVVAEFESMAAQEVSAILRQEFPVDLPDDLPELVEEYDFDEVIEEEKALEPVRPPPLPQRQDRDQIELDQSPQAFWGFAERSLGRVPDPSTPLVGAQSFATGRHSDRSHLVRFANELFARFPKGAHARALAALTLLYVAGQQKERNLLGGPNKERQELLRTGLSLVGESPEAAGQVAVLFENDGPITRESFGAVVDLTLSFLAFCLKNRLDPRKPEAATRFAST